MENILRKLFDYQKFENNKNLSKMIKKVEDEYSQELSEDILSLVNAAGDFDINKIKVNNDIFKNNEDNN